MTNAATASPERSQQGRPSRQRPRWLLVAVLTALLGCWTMIAAPTVSAHNTLEGSDPAANSVVETMPATVSLTFDQNVGPTFAALALTPSGGEPITLQPTVSGDAVTAEVPASAAPAAGTAQAFRLGYRVVSADGHPISGAVDFTVGGTAAIPFGQPPTTLAPTAAGTAAAGTAPTSTQQDGTAGSATGSSDTGSSDTGSSDTAAATAPAGAASGSATAAVESGAVESNAGAESGGAAGSNAPGSSAAAGSSQAAASSDAGTAASSSAPATPTGPAATAAPAESDSSTFPWWWIVVGVVVIGALAYLVVRRMSATDDD
ncbi:copper resistance CopC family protein [Nakamurella aerolata]|uniref:copper resistance CopC family protein n=1 Tax=Nakamurella aerolata TaxID=1656892 RepID=UPI001BB2341D|nr:copper resistance protein CopC [Nakamurella aerolata]